MQGSLGQGLGGGLSPHQQEAAAVVQVLDQSSIQGRTPCA